MGQKGWETRALISSSTLALRRGYYLNVPAITDAWPATAGTFRCVRPVLNWWLMFASFSSDRHTALHDMLRRHDVDRRHLRGSVNVVSASLAVSATSWRRSLRGLDLVTCDVDPVFSLLYVQLFIYLLRQMAAHIKYTNQYTKNTQYTV